MPRPQTGYLYQRPGSANWWIKLQYPPAMARKKVQKSLGTADRREAETLALPMIAEHRRLLLDEENRRRGLFRVRELDYRYPLGESTLDDGTRVIGRHDSATLERDGESWEEENYLTSTIVMRSAPPDLSDPYALLQKPAPKKAVDNDIEHVERWIKHRDVNPYLQKEAREAYRLFKELTGGKRFAAASRDDGRVLVDALFASGNKRATVAKKVSHLCASVNLAIKEGKLKFNPFAEIVPDIDDAEVREPMPEADVALIRANRDAFTPDEWRLFTLCLVTGMRREEAYQINREYNEGGIRYVILRHGKNKQSTRRVPLPDAVLPFLPATITEPLFAPHLTEEADRKKHLKNLGRQTLRHMEGIGVMTPGLHTLRHRAKDRLREAGITHDQQEEILGHERKTVADSYGKGYPVRLLKDWIERIGGL